MGKKSKSKMMEAAGRFSTPESGSPASLPSLSGLDEWDRQINKLQFPGYRLIGKVGAGGMGRVYKATQSSLDRPVAIKVLDKTHLSSDRLRSLFLKEIEVLSKLRHPGIVSIIDAGEVHEMPFLVMEFVEGITLRRLMAAQDLTPEQVVVICGRICDALDAAHRIGIVHYDLKPENVMVSRQGIIKVMDFGIAAMRNAGSSNDGTVLTRTIAGTKVYSAPESVDSLTSDARADVYSLGVMLYEMLTLSLPSTPQRPPSQVNPNCPQWLDKIVSKAQAVSPSDRFTDAGQLLAALEKYGARAKRIAMEAEFAHKAAVQLEPQPSQPQARPIRQFRRFFSRTLGAIAFVSIGCSSFQPYMATFADNTKWYDLPLIPAPFHVPFIMVVTAAACLSLTSACITSDLLRCLLQLLLSATSIAVMIYVLKTDHSLSGRHWSSLLQDVGTGSFWYWGGTIALLLGSILSM